MHKRMAFLGALAAVAVLAPAPSGLNDGIPEKIRMMNPEAPVYGGRRKYRKLGKMKPEKDYDAEKKRKKQAKKSRRRNRA
jgi:hypothetical protein